MRRALAFVGRHIVLFISVAAFAVVISAASVWAVQYDRRESGKLLDGTVIGGVAVGGLEAQAAVEVLRDRIEAPLHRELEVRVGDMKMTTSPWELGLQVDVRAAVDQAVERAQEGSIASRLWRRLSDHEPRPMAASPAWGPGRTDALLEGAANEIRLEPRNASLDYSSGWISIAPDRVGRALDMERSREALLQAVRLGDHGVTLETSTLEPEVKASDFATVILVRAGENKLYLYENGSITKTWNVATGSASFPTPTGLWKVVNKQVNPTWINPGSAWARSMPARIGPGPGNPLGSHALGLNAPGILIHATSDRSSIGFSASHGCIRMLTENEIELFGMVPVGTPVAIVNAGPPKPRGSAPAPADPNQAAVVQF